MPPNIAALAYLGLSFFLFWWDDVRKKPNVTSALWIPFLWVFVSGTRFVTQWLLTFGINVGGDSYEEGSFVDAIFFGGMTVLAIRVLIRRRITVTQFNRYNALVTFYILFCLAACLWSDYPFVAFKRWIKLIGQVAMVLVVLTEPDPHEAVVRLFKRIGYFLVPLSALFIKYFPQWGRVFDNWTGAACDCGIALDKNAMGYDCMWISVVLFWHIVELWKQPKGRQRWKSLGVEIVFFIATMGLLVDAHSSTALVCALVGCFIIFWTGFRWVKPRLITVYLLAAAFVAFVAEYLFDFTKFFITQILHKDMTLTDRTKIWEALWQFDINPIFGTGYESFWLGERREQMWILFPNLFLNSAHNGYLQAYLDMGLLGLAVTIALVIAAYRQSIRALFSDFYFGRLRLGLVIAFVFYNWTEVAFRTHCVPFFGFLLGAIFYPASNKTQGQNPMSLAESDNEPVG